MTSGCASKASCLVDRLDETLLSSRRSKTRICSVVIGHKQPLFLIPDGYMFVGKVAVNDAELSLQIEDDILGEAFDGKIIAEYLQLFWLFLFERPKCLNVDYVHIAQYRKFASRVKGKLVPPAMPYLYSEGPKSLHSALLTDFELCSLVDTERELTGPILQIGKMVSNYSRYHLAEDFVAFVATLARSELFGPADLKEVGGYLLERLHSYLMLRRKISCGFRGTEIGFQYVVSDGDSATANVE